MATAVRDTAEAFEWGDWQKVAVKAIISGLLVFIPVYLGFTAAGFDELRSGLRGLVATFAAFSIFFVIYVICTPHRLDREVRDELKDAQKRCAELESEIRGKDEKKRNALLALAKKRGEGISIRNDLLGIRLISDLAPLIVKAEQWERDVLGLVGSFSELDAELFSRLGDYQRKTFGIQYLSEGHLEHVSELTERLNRLDTLIAEHKA